MRHVRLQLLVEPGQHDRRLLRRQVCQHQGDRLRVLVGEEGEQLAGIGPAHPLERHLRQGGAQPFHDLVGAFVADALGQQRASQLETAAAGHVGAAEGVARLGQYRLGVVVGHLAQPDDLGREVLDHLVGEPGHDLDGLLPAQLDEQDRGLAQAGQPVRGDSHRSSAAQLFRWLSQP